LWAENGGGFLWGILGTFIFELKSRVDILKKSKKRKKKRKNEKKV